LIWRNLGYTDQNGKFIPPISFVDVPQLPSKMLKVFFALDDLTLKMSQQQAKKTKGKKTR
jgi:hypothetical protein